MKLIKIFISTLVFFSISYYAASNINTRKNERQIKEPEVGELAPEISLPDPYDNVIKLSSLRGKVVLIDFWAAWCIPCRRENPQIVEVYNHFKDQNFTIFSVSLDHNKQMWVKAIEKDHLEWGNHVSDLKGWYNEAALKYDVEEIPKNYLIDQKGKIIAKNKKGKELEAIIKKYLD